MSLDLTRKEIEQALDRLILKADHDIFWKTYHPHLQDTPLNLVRTKEGADRVLELLEGMETGAFL